jgi:hypothetical protein
MVDVVDVVSDESPDGCFMSPFDEAGRLVCADRLQKSPRPFSPVKRYLLIFGAPQSCK